MIRKLLTAGAVLVALVVAGSAALAFAGGALDFSTYDPVGVNASGEPTRSAAADPPAGDGERFVIDATRSQVTFDIDEVLRGEPTTVTGTTSAVEGTFALDPDDPTDVRVGPLTIDAGTLTTDSSLRDRAIRGPILGGQPIVFDAIRVRDIVDGDGELRFAVDGDLTVDGRTRQVTFDAAARPAAGDAVAVVAEARVRRADFGLTIPSVPFVAEVADTVTLRADLVAVSA
jgi:polyisoprenoid-binding protein YceI